MIFINSDHPFHPRIQYQFIFEEVTGKSAIESLESSIEAYKKCVKEKQIRRELKGDNKIVTAFIPVVGSPYEKYIYTTVEVDGSITHISIHVDSIKIWHKWITHLKREYHIYTPPSISDLMQFLQEAPAC